MYRIIHLKVISSISVYGRLDELSIYSFKMVSFGHSMWCQIYAKDKLINIDIFGPNFRLNISIFVIYFIPEQYLVQTCC
jgi:hypothetical protein